MRTLFLLCLALFLPAMAGESPRTYPFWDGKESVESYAKKVNLPATKSLDLGNGMTLDLVLVPAGQFIMGTPEPVTPTVNEVDAALLCCFGAGATSVLLMLLIIKYKERQKLAFSLRWLLLMMISTGVFFGGIAYWTLALKETTRYEAEMVEFNKLPADEKPAHSVTLTQPFYMGKYPVTQEQYGRLAGIHGCYFEGAQFPVEMISLGDATEFCKKLNVALNNKVLEACLPTEAQWEYACRAGTQTCFNNGDRENDLDSAGWYYSNSNNTTHSVGKKKVNAFGLYDMHGNVREWCADRMTENYVSAQTINPFNNEVRIGCVIRGGSYLNAPIECRSSNRHWSTTGQGDPDIGFRVVLNLSDKSR